MARSEYSRLRGIASKRLERLSAQGLTLPGINLPKASELKTPSQRSKAEQMLRSFIQNTSLRSVKEQGLKVGPGRGGKIVTLTEKQIKGREKRERQQRKRQEILSQYTRKQQGFIKGAQKLGINISNTNIPYFIEYMETRFSQVIDSKFYVFADFAEDFDTAVHRDPKQAREIIADFERFQADRENLYLSMLENNSESLTEEYSRIIREQWRKAVRGVE